MIIREKFFETNSSSTHALCLGKGGLVEPNILLKKYGNSSKYEYDCDNVVEHYDYLEPFFCYEDLYDLDDFDDCLDIRRLNSIGRDFKIFSSVNSKLNFIWSCLMSDFDYFGADLVKKFIGYLNEIYYKCKVTIVFSDVCFTIAKCPENYNFQYLGTFESDFGTMYLYGEKVYGYVPKKELVRVLSDRTLFFNLVLGNSKIYTGSDETDLFEDLDFNNYGYNLVGGSDNSPCNPDNIYSYEGVKELGSYINGNYKTVIYEDGTRKRVLTDPKYYDQGLYIGYNKFNIKEIDAMQPDFPESIDLKITNRCNNNCRYCYANSSSDGRHADLTDVLDVIDCMMPNTEIAIGGGDILEYPWLEQVLLYAQFKNVIVNITIRDIDYLNNFRYINKLVSDGLIKGIGLSYTNIDTLKQLGLVLTGEEHIVLHLILGLISIEELDLISGLFKYKRILFLGYKNKGRGSNFYIKNRDYIDKNIEDFKNYDFYSLYDHIIAFDNLAINQLNINVNDYETQFQGDDGKFSFYIDLVEKSYSLSSVDDKSYEFKTVYDSFNSLADKFRNWRSFNEKEECETRVECTDG